MTANCFTITYFVKIFKQNKTKKKKENQQTNKRTKERYDECYCPEICLDQAKKWGLFIYSLLENVKI